MDHRHDIFISYAHIDNEGPEWVTHFHEALRIRVSQLLGREVRVWRDLAVGGNKSLWSEIESAIEGSATFVCVFSPRYLDSPSCKREVATILDLVERGPGGGKDRIFKVIKTDVPRDSHPAPLRDRIGYAFLEPDPQTGRPRELSQQRGSDAYFAKLEDVAYGIKEQLTATRTSNGVKPIFLATTSFDLSAQHDEIQRDLVLQGYPVRPDRPLPLVRGELESFLEEQLQGCQLSVHMVGSSYGVVPDGTEDSVVRIQNRVARSSPTESHRLIWIPTGLSVGDSRQERFIDELRNNPEMHRDADVLETSLEDLKTALHRVLERARETKEVEWSDVLQIFLIRERPDAGDTVAFEDHLYEAGFQVLPTFFPESPEEEKQVRSDNKENLEVCDAAVVYFCSGNEAWLWRKLRELQRSVAYRDRGPPLQVVIDDRPEGRRLPVRQAEVIEMHGAFDALKLAPFLGRLSSLRREELE